jgi:hypothetical protein
VTILGDINCSSRVSFYTSSSSISGLYLFEDKTITAESISYETSNLEIEANIYFNSTTTSFYFYLAGESKFLCGSRCNMVARGSLSFVINNVTVAGNLTSQSLNLSPDFNLTVLPTAQVVTLLLYARFDYNSLMCTT